MVLAGGTGGVGEGIARALLLAGHRVIVPSRSTERLALLRSRLRESGADDERLVTLLGHVGDGDEACLVAETIVREHGRVDALVPSLGGWWEGRRLLDVDPATWDVVMAEMLRTHFIFARAFVPLLERQGGGRYIGIGGGAAYYPIVGSSLVSIAAAAQLMLTRVLRAEIGDPRIEILELVVDGPVRTRDSETFATPEWIGADEVGAIVCDLVESGRTTAPATSTQGPIVRMRANRAA